jgi:hypothetical protein
MTRVLRAAAAAGQQISAIHIDRDGQVTLQVAPRAAAKEAEDESTTA